MAPGLGTLPLLLLPALTWAALTWAVVAAADLPLPKSRSCAATTDYASERAPLLSTDDVRSLVAVDHSTAFPGAVPTACGSVLAGTAHAIHCVGDYPVGGVILEPPLPPTRTVLFLHGLIDKPPLYLSLLSLLLRAANSTSARSRWQSTRLLVPFAPAYPRLFRDAGADQGVPAGRIHAWFDNSHTFPYIPVGALAGATPGGVAAALVATGVVEDRPGLAASTARLAALASAQAAGALDGALPPVAEARTAVVGHSNGGGMAWHLAVRSGVTWAGVVAMSGHLPLTPLYERYPPLARAGRRPFSVASVAGANDTVVDPRVSEAAAVVGRRLLGGDDAVTHVTLPGSDHMTYLLGDANTPTVVGLLERALDGAEE